VFVCVVCERVRVCVRVRACRARAGGDCLAGAGTSAILAGASQIHENKVRRGQVSQIRREDRNQRAREKERGEERE